MARINIRSKKSSGNNFMGEKVSNERSKHEKENVNVLFPEVEPCHICNSNLCVDRNSNSRWEKFEHICMIPPIAFNIHDVAL